MSDDNVHPEAIGHPRTGMTAGLLERAIRDNLFYAMGRPLHAATDHDFYMAVAYTIRDRILARWVDTAARYKSTAARTVCYFSAEYLLGPHLSNNVNNLGIAQAVQEACRRLGLDFDTVADQEEEPGLGNGGLGRLAACYLDSMATLQIPCIGYGLRYEFGIFDQEIRDGWQHEVSDLWLRNGNPWELERPKLRFRVKLGGHTEHHTDASGSLRVRWVPGFEVNGVAFDTPILGHRVETTNLLRLWKSEATRSFDFQAFNTGDYYGAVDEKISAETISKVLYPNDEPTVGKELRLTQQYFFVSCSLQDMMRIHLDTGGRIETFHEKFVAQLNDTHPALAVAELMRLLVDEHGLPWDAAWDITCKTFAYTNHTLLPEALESWPVPLLERLLPRPLEIIYEINRRFLDRVRLRFPGDDARVDRLSLIDDSGERRVRMAHLATVGSFAVNGVAAMHSDLVKSTVLRDFHDLWPDRFHNVTNGVSPRRFVQIANPPLSALLSRTIGPDWAVNMDRLPDLERHASDPAFLDEWRRVKRSAKERLAKLIDERTGVRVDPDSLFDVQAKRIHEYKRQHLNLLHILRLYQLLKEDPSADLVPRTFVFGGKAAPGYFMAKLIIRLVTAVAELINDDPQISRRLKVVFFPDFNVKSAQPIYPAADLSEQISLAGKEASGTGNMKFAMNGALTIGTLDGANVEIRDAVGADNFFLFGMTEPEVHSALQGGYRPGERYYDDPELRGALDLLDSGLLGHGDTELFRPIKENLLHHDPFMVLADFRDYADRQRDVDGCYRDADRWARMSTLNAARVARFSSDRSVADYCARIWDVNPSRPI